MQSIQFGHHIFEGMSYCVVQPCLKFASSSPSLSGAGTWPDIINLGGPLANGRLSKSINQENKRFGTQNDKIMIYWPGKKKVRRHTWNGETVKVETNGL